MTKGKRKVESQPSSFWTPTRIGMTGAVLILLAIVGSTFLRGSEATAPPPNVTTRTMPSRPATLTALSASAMDSSIQLLNGGQPVRLADYAGKVIIVDLWATWCGPCRVEIPYLKELATEFKDRGLEVIGLTTEDKTRDTEVVKSFVKEFKINYAIGWANREIVTEVMSGRGSIPQTLVIGRDGKIRKHLVGFNPRIAPVLRSAVEGAISE